MASLFELSVGQHSELLKRLAAGGMTQDDVKLILSLPDPNPVVSKMIFALRQTMFQGLFELPQVQVENMLDWIRIFGWDLGENDLPEPPRIFLPRTPSEALVLCPTFGPADKLTGAQHTVKRVWEAVTHEVTQEGISVQPLTLQFGSDEILPYRAAKDARRRRVGLRWVVIDFAAAWGSPDAATLQDAFGADGAQAELLIAMAHFPRLIKAMTRQEAKLPAMLLGGWTVKYGGRDVLNVPLVSFATQASISTAEREQRLSFGYTGGDSEDWRASWRPTSSMLAPTVREL